MKRLGRPPKSVAKAKSQDNVITAETVSSRVGGRERKAKKVFDPSENNTPKKRTKTSKSTERLRSESIETKPKPKVEKHSPKSKVPNLDEFCSICNKEEKKLKFLVNCNDCNLKAHHSCLDINFVDKKLLESKWRCDNCKTCAICYETEEIGPLITCSICINSYHVTCHVPKVNPKVMKPKDWRCTKCPLPLQVTTQKQTFVQVLHSKPLILKQNISDNSSLSQSSESSFSSAASSTIQNNQTGKKESHRKNSIIKTGEKIGDTDSQKNHIIKLNDRNLILNQKLKMNEIPDISSWSRDKLAEFLRKIFPAEAEILKQENIDGRSLLLMTRADVLSLGLKLGPSLRLYNFIVLLQTRKYDCTATWIY